MIFDPLRQRKIYTVYELTLKVKQLLEDQFPFIWITGEISNYRVPASGHFYFVLKDEKAQINALMFRSQNRNLSFEPEDGMQIIGLGRISLYEPRGAYQIILEYLEPMGVGALRVAFEQLKRRLFEEGLFDERSKKALPFLPKKISILTSPTGAVVHDIIKILDRRFPNVHIEIVPVKVQGDDAEEEIKSGLSLINDRHDSDVIILARGGGSLEDLIAFNSEEVARAVFKSEIPVISAIGHETDYTIVDFVSDLRAPTPSAAAERVVPHKEELKRRNQELINVLTNRFGSFIEHAYSRLDDLSKRLISPRRKIEDLKLQTDDLSSRLMITFINRLKQKRERFLWQYDRFMRNGPQTQISNLKKSVERIKYNLFNLIKIYTDNRRALLRELTASLYALSPMKILDRGYSIARTIDDKKVVKDPKTLAIGQYLEMIVSKGRFISRVERKMSNGEADV